MVEPSKRLLYITSNRFKFHVAQVALRELDIVLEQSRLPAPEIQSNSVRDIAEFSAQWASQHLDHPFIVTDSGFYIEMGQFTDAGAIMTNWHRFVAKDITVMGSWAFTENDLALGVKMLSHARRKYPWYEIQTIYPFDADGVSRAVADAMAMRTVKSTIVPWPELLEA